MEKGRTSASREHLNSLRPSIQFTMDMEENSSLPFLDTLLRRNDEGLIETSVYRKPTHTDCYLQYSSHHPNHVKCSMVFGLFHRARAIAQGEKRKIEERYLTQVLLENGYPHGMVKMATQERQGRREEEQPHHTLYIPYVSGLGEDLRRISRKFNIRIVFRTSSTLKRELCRFKDRDSVMLRSGVVYEIPCSCGQRYIGETRRTLGTRLKEHQAATRRGEIEKLAIAEHACINTTSPFGRRLGFLIRQTITPPCLSKRLSTFPIRTQGTW